SQRRRTDAASAAGAALFKNDLIATAFPATFFIGNLRRRDATRPTAAEERKFDRDPNSGFWHVCRTLSAASGERSLWQLS
ncbi:MAG: hypothetical protein K2X41_03175, partial [Hyphomicrobium sp.]|nr:hypothetical protein [Hyphomicrobium sp.]